MILQVRDSAGNVFVRRDGLTADEALALADFWIHGTPRGSSARLEIIADPEAGDPGPIATVGLMEELT